MRGSDGTVLGFEGVLEDRTAEIEANRDVEASLRFRAGLIGSVAHALRTPLTGVLGFASMLADQLEGQHAEMAHVICQQAQEFAITVDNFVTAARLEGGSGFTVIARPSSVKSALDDVVATMEKMGLRPPEARIDEDALVRCDPLRLSQAIRMLVQHRLQLGATSVDLRVATLDDRVVLELTDDGPPVADEAVGWFDDPRGGFGPVGPWAAARLLELMGGRLEQNGSEGVNHYRLTLAAAQEGATEQEGDSDGTSAHQQAGETAGGDARTHDTHDDQKGDVADQAHVEDAEGEGADDLDSVVQG